MARSIADHAYVELILSLGSPMGRSPRHVELKLSRFRLHTVGTSLGHAALGAAH